MDTRQLRVFLKIAEMGSITRAANALDLAQPSLSQQLLRLEDEVGSKLFRRTARGVTMTEAGLVFEDHARRILRCSEQALEEMQRFKGEALAKVTLAMPFSVSKLLGVQLAEATMQEAPSVSLRLVEAFSGQVRAMLDEGSIDLGLLYDVEPLDHLSVERLSSEELFLVGPPGRLGGVDSRSTVGDLSALPLILPGPQHGLRQFLDREAQRLGFRLRVVSEIDSLQHIAGLVSDGHGYTILPLSAVEGEIQAGAVSAASVGDGAFRRTLCLARRSGAAVSDASRRVAEVTVKTVARMTARRSSRAGDTHASDGERSETA